MGWLPLAHGKLTILKVLKENYTWFINEKTKK